MTEKRRILTDKEFDALFSHQINDPTIEISNCPSDGVFFTLPIDGEKRVIMLTKASKEKLIADLNNLVEVQKKEAIAMQISRNE